ncbi:RDD family protein [Oceanicoccus sp. KOV_DT_Chl]|uniref:RDD family protein n=1 Tax=Oceanicoccus sp. KOV_DT_Chl TaxID=1904639 RepID=UPI000C7C1C92|nr:RDD family protein [Oceanicoccus sp. KOV_DT_Chl]
MSTTAAALPTAGVIRRLIAMIYDALLVFAVLFAATIPTVFLPSNPQQTINNEDVVHELPTLVDGWPFQIYILVIYCSFFCWFWHKNGQTLGMQAWRLQIEDLEGNRISWRQCLLRLGCAGISLMCLGAGYWWIWIDKNGYSWHDRWSKSRMVVLPKKTKK